jgi:RNA polymerase sigma-70 factor, ECF subfamily
MQCLLLIHTNETGEAALSKAAPKALTARYQSFTQSKVDGTARELDLLDALTACHHLKDYHLDHHLVPALRGELLRRLDRRDEARQAYRNTPVPARLDPERRSLARHMAEIG